MLSEGNVPGNNPCIDLAVDLAGDSCKRNSAAAWWESPSGWQNKVVLWPVYSGEIVTIICTEWRIGMGRIRYASRKLS